MFWLIADQLSDQLSPADYTYPYNRFMDNSPTNQLADKHAEIDIMMFRLTPKCNGNYESSALSL